MTGHHAERSDLYVTRVITNVVLGKKKILALPRFKSTL